MVRRCMEFMQQRTACVRWGATESGWRLMREATAQGTKSAPSLFAARVDDMPTDLQLANDAVCMIQADTKEECVRLTNK